MAEMNNTDRRSLLKLVTVLGASVPVLAGSANAGGGIGAIFSPPTPAADNEHYRVARQFVTRYRKEPDIRREFRSNFAAMRRKESRGETFNDEIYNLGRFILTAGGGNPDAPAFIVVVVIIIILVLIPIVAS